MVAALLATAASAPAERVVSGDFIVPISINGIAGRFRVDPGAPGLPLVTTAFARRAKFKSGSIGISLGYKVGPERAVHGTVVATIDEGGNRYKRRVGWPFQPRQAAGDTNWVGRSYGSLGDGTVGPGALPDAVIRFVLRPARAGEHTVSLPMVDGGGPFGRFAGLDAQIIVGGEPLRVRFDPFHPRSVANATAGVRLAAAYGGHLRGAASPVEIAFGIERPVRAMLLDRPVAIGSLSMRLVGVRTGDGAMPTNIPDAGAATPPADPDEIVVVAKGKRRTDGRLSIGADLLDRCSSMVFDKPAKQIRLTCG